MLSQKMYSISVKGCCLQILPLTQGGPKGFEEGRQRGEEDGSGRPHWQPQSVVAVRRVLQQVFCSITFHDLRLDFSLKTEVMAALLSACDHERNMLSPTTDKANT